MFFPKNFCTMSEHTKILVNIKSLQKISNSWHHLFFRSCAWCALQWWNTRLRHLPRCPTFSLALSWWIRVSPLGSHSSNSSAPVSFLFNIPYFWRKKLLFLNALKVLEIRWIRPDSDLKTKLNTCDVRTTVHTLTPQSYRLVEDFFWNLVNFFGGLQCVGHSLSYVENFVFLRDVWIRTQRAAVASRLATVPT